MPSSASPMLTVDGSPRSKPIRPPAGPADLVLHAIAALACEIATWMQLRAPTGHQARRGDPRWLRLGVQADACV
ncbi:MAG: hypothetical protein QOG46_1153 [Pseudonocardiales bacterium]|nr:hypothetical protein [Pseudonocardiales bacterium]